MRWIANTSVVLLGLLGAAALAGCGDSRRYVSQSSLNTGLVLVLPGIEGRSRFNDDIIQGLFDGGVNSAIELNDWTSPLGPLYNLRAQEINRAKAREIASKVVEYQASHPGKPVVLVGQSGGGAIALWVAEVLPEGTQVDGIVLLAAALSPEYDLSAALRHSRNGIVNYYSSLDWFLLGMGTTMAGTMDGKHEQSAGRVGFKPPAGTPYEKLYQVPWRPEMMRSGNIGAHLTSGSLDFVSIYVAPLVRSSSWSKESIDRVLGYPGVNVP